MWMFCLCSWIGWLVLRFSLKWELPWLTFSLSFK